MSEWQPIESAPKDGTLVLCAAGALMASCMYRSHMTPNWVLPGQNGWIWPFGKEDPTHWMPLPAPPVDVTQKAKTTA